MKTRYLLIALAACTIIAACGNKHSRQADLDNITRFEDSIDIQNSIISVETGNRLIDLYNTFSTNHPSDTLAPVYLHRAAQVAANIHRPDLALQYLDTVIFKYPDYEDVAVCEFYKGFVLETVAGDMDAARAAYLDFISNHPDDPLAKDAQIMVDNLGLTGEELLEKVLGNADSANNLAESK